MDLLTDPAVAATEPAEPVVTLVVHAVNTTVHTTVPPGWRWAVHVGRPSLADTAGCANAGWCPTQSEAQLEGEMVAAALVRGGRLMGLPIRYGQLLLDHDPIPAERDYLNSIRP